MAQASVFSGARAKIRIYDNKTGKGKVVGLFSNCTWSVRQTKEPIFILGRFHPAEIVPTAQEAVQMTLTGYRVIEKGPYATMNASMLKDLLFEEDFTVEVLDRRNKDKVIFQAKGCRVSGWSSGVATRGISDVRIEVIGILGTDEFGIQQGGDGDVPSGGLAGSNITDGDK